MDRAGDCDLPVLAQPGAADHWRLPFPFRHATPDDDQPAALIAADDDGWRRLVETHRSPFTHALPVLGLDPDMRCADRIDASPDGLLALRGAGEMATSLATGWPQPPHADLLAYLLLRDAELAPEADYANPAIFHYRAARRFAELEAMADELAEGGYLARSLSEKISECPACRSARLLIREQCPSCASPDMRDVPILHHFVCAHQAAEDGFRDGTALVCPKCRQVLRHHSIDYERSATVCRCEACGSVSAEPSVGYRCLDCDARGEADRLRERAYHRYALTGKARRSFVERRVSTVIALQGSLAAAG